MTIKEVWGLMIRNFGLMAILLLTLLCIHIFGTGSGFLIDGK